MIDDRIHAHFIEQAGWCHDLGSTFTAKLLIAMAADLRSGGIVHELVGDWCTNPRRDALGLRLAGALHHAALNRTAPRLTALYPAANPGWTMEQVWPVARDYLARHRDSVTAFVQSPPQTNETRRCIALLPAFLDLAAGFNGPMDLLELGASAGLNQNWDRYNYRTAGWQRQGTSNVLIETDWDGPPPQHLPAALVIRSRAACDLGPLDLSDPAQALRLRSYVWPDQPERLDRLDAAIALARETDVKVDRADAAEWLEAKLANRRSDGMTVIYHSVFLIYPPLENRQRIQRAIEAAGADATPEAPLAWVCFEPEPLFGGEPASGMMRTRLQAWPGGAARFLNQSDGHVTSVRMLEG
jgi:hypothetical protein